MENAAQALLIAGGILLAILTLSLLVYMSNNVSTIGTAQAQEKEAKRLAAWNAEWEAYDKTRLYGVDVLTVVNKAEQNNADYEDSELYEVLIVDENDNKITAEYITDYKKSIFECIGVEYNNQTGRVNKMTFNLVEDLR